MKYLPIYVLLALLFSACKATSDNEIAELKKENAALRKQLNQYDQAIVITKENINKYVGALTYGHVNVKTNEETEVGTCLYLHHLPVEVKWTEDQENQSVSESGPISRYIKNTFAGPGKRKLSGNYKVVFRNGEEWMIPWEHEVDVK